MVYDSDFYTSRRLYSRPTVSSYSVTTPSVRFVPGFTRVHTYSYPIVTHRTIPYYGSYGTTYGGTSYGSNRLVRTRVISSPVRDLYSPVRDIYSPIRDTYSPIRVIRSPVRIVTSPVRVIRSSGVRAIRSPFRVVTSPFRDVTSPVRITKVRKSVVTRSRPHSGYLPTQEYLNSEATRLFDDETRDIRADSNHLLKQIHAKSIRAASIPPANYLSKYESVFPTKPATDAYLQRIYDPIRSAQNDSVANYEPANTRKYAGKSHLASVRIVGNKGYYKRQAVRDSYTPTTKVQNDVKFMSYYLKQRQEANKKSDIESAKLDPYRPSRKFTQPLPLEDPNEEIKQKQAERLERAGNVSTVSHDIDLEKVKAKRLDEAKRLEERALLEEANKKAESKKREEQSRAAELARQEALAAQAAAERANELEKKEAEAAKLAEAAQNAEAARLAEEARIAEEARLAEEAHLAEEARLAEEAKLAEEARIAEEARLAEEAKLAEEKRQRDEELIRLAELERIAEEEKEADLARQAAELSEIARQEAELAEKRAKRNQEDGDGFGFEDVPEEPAPEEPAPEEQPVVEEPESPAIEETVEETEVVATEESEAVFEFGDDEE